MKKRKQLYIVFRQDGFRTTTMAVSRDQAINQVAWREAQKVKGSLGLYRPDGITVADYDAIAER